MRRDDGNFAAWADFKAWMDVSFARALRTGTDAVHAADPSALAAIEGVQLPGWGGYDYSLLVGSVDLMELDDLPLAHSLNPRLVTLTTSFRGTPDRLHMIWRDLLEGSRGLILWDSRHEVVDDAAALGERGRAYAGIFAEIRGGLGRLLLTSEPQADPVAILYSPASFRTQWMLEQKPKGDAWMTRQADTELESNAARDAMWAYRAAAMHLGLQPVYVSSAMLAAGDVQRRGFRTLLLPHAIALSPEEAEAIRVFAQAGGTVIADVRPGVFDGHSRRQPMPLLDRAMLRMIPPANLAAAALGVSPAIHVEAPNGDVVVHTWHHDDELIVAVQRDFGTGAEETITLTLPKPAEVYDLRSKQPLGHTQTVSVSLGPVTPALLSVR
jgi:hypothetical protein